MVVWLWLIVGDSRGPPGQTQFISSGYSLLFHTGNDTYDTYRYTYIEMKLYIMQLSSSNVGSFYHLLVAKSVSTCS